MRTIRLLALLAIGALTAAHAVAASAQENRETRAAGAGPDQTSGSPAPIYKPPRRGAPGGRVGGGTRGADARAGSAERAVFLLSVLAPDHTGLTISEQPSLYWYISSRAPAPVEVTVVDPRATKPVLEIRLSSPVEAGVHRIRLADHGVRLEPGVAYRWFVAVVPDTNRRAKDFLTGGAIERVALPEALRGKLASADRTRAPAIYAESGYWYDAVEAISVLIDDTAGDPALEQQRAALLQQVGLPGIAD